MYNGVCIGGKMDGDLHSWDKLCFKIVDYPPLSNFKLSATDHPTAIESHYNFHSLADTRKGIWVHSSITLNIALLMMLDNYGRKDDDRWIGQME